MSEYEASILKWCSNFWRRAETVIFTGWSPGRWESFSGCCNADLFMDRPGDLGPSCKSCGRPVMFDNIRREWVPPHKTDPNSKMNCPWPMEPETEP